MIHTCSVRVPRMRLCALHSAVVWSLPVLYRWITHPSAGATCATLPVLVCVDESDCDGLLLFSYLKCFWKMEAICSVAPAVIVLSFSVLNIKM